MGTTAEKLTYLNGTKRLLRRRLNSLGANITLDTRFRDYLLWLDRFYEAASSSVDFKILGETTQEQYTSPNLLPNNVQSQTINGVTITRNDDGSLVLNGTASDSITISIYDNLELEAGTYYFNFYDTTTPTYFHCSFENNSISYTIDNNKSITFANNITGNVKLIIPVTVAVNNLVVHPMITEGSTAQPYEPYGTKPSVAIPSEIINKEGELTYTASDGTEFPVSLGTGSILKLKDGTYTKNGITAVVSNNEVTLNGTILNSTSSIEIPSNLRTLNGDYTLSLHEVSGTYTGYDSRASNFAYFRVQSKSNNSNYMSVEVSLNDGIYNHDDFSNEEVKVVMRTSPSYGRITFTDYKFKPQILKGWYKTEPPYTPYSSIELCEIGDYQDSIYYKNGSFYLEKQIAKIDSYNGETITTDYISTTGGLNTGSTIYYVLSEPTITEITEGDLYNQLKAIIDYETKLQIEKKIF